jgi:DNA topoisomerase-2
MTSIDELFPYGTVEESITEKDWAAGSSLLETHSEYVIKSVNKKLVAIHRETKYAPALWKIFDEPIVNMLDHVVRTRLPDHIPSAGSVVTELRITFTADGRIKMTNNGEGIPTGIHEKASSILGRPTHAPTLVCGHAFQGSNKVRDPQSIIGGTNGLGVKLSNLFSTEFAIETVDNKKMYFLQRWKRSIDKKTEVIDDPIVVDLNSPHKIPASRCGQHTTVSFMPNYVGIFGYDSFNESLYNELVDIFRTRTVYAAAYAGKSVKVYFNDELINVHSISDIAKILYPDRQIINTTIAPKYDETKLTHDPKAKTQVYAKLPWDISIIIGGGINTSIVNGCVVSDGTHIRRIINDIESSVTDKIKKDVGEAKLSSIIKSHISVMISAKVPSPSWGGQRKDNLTTNIKRFDKYTLDDKTIDIITKHVKNFILSSIEPPKEKKEKIPPYDKIIPATNAGKANSDCSLLAVEGDSAMDQLRVGLSNVLGNNNYGLVSLGGVIMNVRKQSEEVETSKGTFWKKTKKLMGNKFVKHFINEVGLNLDYKYDSTSKTYAKEMKELKYKRIVLCVDQDLDGKGHILGLFLSLMEYWWPNLIANGFVSWFETVIIRGYPKSGGEVLDFYSLHSYESWAKTANTSAYDIRYYKGLASHDRDEIINMFEHYHEHLYTYSLDPKAKEMFEIYFGDSPDARKKELSTPAEDIPNEIRLLQEQSKIIYCSDHLRYETKVYDKDNIERKLISVIDGQNQAGRIILSGSLKALNSKTKLIKTAQIAGDIAKSENYHHGEAGLALSVSGRCLVTTGGYQVPLIRGVGNHGSRANTTPGSSRYTFIRANEKLTNLVIPREHYYLLDFVFDEGKRGPPKFFVPTIPLSVLETVSIPATGWKIETWARDYRHVFTNVRRMIKYGQETSFIDMKPAIYAGAPYEWRGSFRYARGNLYSVGKYALTDNQMIITELPLRVWSADYKEFLGKLASKENALIEENIIDECGDISVKFTVTFKEGAKQIIEDLFDEHWFDGFEEYFKLRDAMHNHINMLGPNKEVISMDEYETPMRLWFPHCKKMHHEELIRARKMCELEIRMINNIIRYIEMSNELGISKKKSTIQIQILEDNKFEKCASSLIKNPKFIPTDKLEYVIFGGIIDTKYLVDDDSDENIESNASYKYLLNLSDSKKSSESLADYKNRVNQLELEIAAIDVDIAHPLFPGAGRWLDRLDKIEKIIEEGSKTFWKFDEEAKYVRSAKPKEQTQTKPKKTRGKK